MVALAALFVIGCQKSDKGQYWQGYVEADYTYVASPLAGRLQDLAVQRGERVSKGQVLFGLERVIEKQAQNEAIQLLDQAREKLADLQKGARPSEISAIKASLAKAQSYLDLSILNYKRKQELYRKNSLPKAQLDQARSLYNSDKAQVAELEAQLETARLGGREDQVKAAESEVKALEAKLAEASWNFGQKIQKAGDAGVVFDTLYTKGELVQAGRPVVVLLTPENLKVRFFVPQADLASLRLGQTVFLSCDGCPQGLKANISFISPEAEYTPPVIYSRHSRDKLVFMAEAKPAAKEALDLHPGQPMEVMLKQNQAVE
ncbi:HlyD family secretion protein [Dethiosulfatarculus sandiegensis]|nr:HlyD family efflux transporter periplasmic adaptor subunit [Dethiosulfatarculus sandiegensis]